MDSHHAPQGYSRYTFHEFGVVREERLEPATPGGPITLEEWLQLVARDDDLVVNPSPRYANGAVDDQAAWRLRSHEDGTPIFFADGRVFIREDDALTLAKLQQIAEELGGVVVGEDGQEYIERGGTAAAADGARSTKRLDQAGLRAVGRFSLDEERVRRRQIGLMIAVGCLVPLYTAWLLWRGENPGVLLLLGAGSLGLVIYGMIRVRVPRYFVAVGADGRAVVQFQNEASTSDELVEKELTQSQLDPIELVWFSLKIGKRTLREYHVRCSKEPWIVFFAGANLAKAQRALAEIARAMNVGSSDQSAGPAAEGVPKKYLDV
jgi:hypothetical protein